MKDVHTEHCCWVHGCKYGDPNCTVILNVAKQSFPCEECPDPDTLAYKIRNKTTGLYKRKRAGSHGWNKQGDNYRSAGMARAAAKYSGNDIEIVEFTLTETRVVE